MSTPSPAAPASENSPAGDPPGTPPPGTLPVHVHMAPPPPDDPPPADPPLAHHRRLITLINWLLVLVGAGMIIGSQVMPEKSRVGNLNEIMLGIGLALAPGGALALIADWLVFGTLIDVLSGSTRALGKRTLSLQREISALQGSTRELDSSIAEKNERLGREINELRVSTEFLKRSSDLGLEMIYPDRATALRDFVRYLRQEVERPNTGGRIMIVGSSIKGLLENVPEIGTVVERALERGCELRILLTHPKYSKYRENQEDRPTGAIEDEIFDGIRRLESCRPVDYPDTPDRDLSSTLYPDETKLKLYKGTPTCFMIVAGDHMLINPYSYEEEAYRSFCITVRRVEPGSASVDVERTIYAQYLRAHFQKAWERNSVPYRHYWLEGPDPARAWNRRSCYGDVFVVQDAGHFYLSVNLMGPREAPVRGMPTSIPCMETEDGSEFMKLPGKFSIRLLDARTYRWRALDGEIGQLSLHLDRRRAKASEEISGNLLNDYVMLGLFDASEDDDTRVVSIHKHDPPPHETLAGEPLPLFFVWLRGKPGAPHAPHPRPEPPPPPPA